MNRRLAAIAIASLPLGALAAESVHHHVSASEFPVRRSSIIILLDSPAEQAKERNSNPNYGEATGDFGVYTERMLRALKDHKQIAIRWSHAKRISFPGTRFPAVIRSQVGGGWGYVFYKPGTPPVVVEGVAVDDELVCRAATLFVVQVDGYKCEA